MSLGHRFHQRQPDPDAADSRSLRFIAADEPLE